MSFHLTGGQLPTPFGTRDEGWIQFIADSFWSTNCKGQGHTAVPALCLCLPRPWPPGLSHWPAGIRGQYPIQLVGTSATEMAKEFNSYSARSDFSKMLPTTLKTASGGAPLLCPPSFAPYPREEATHVLTEGKSTVAPLCLCTSSHAVPYGWWVPCFSQHGFPYSLVCPPPLHSLGPWCSV